MEGGRAFVVDKSDQVGSSVPDIWTVGKGKGTRIVLLLRGHCLWVNLGGCLLGNLLVIG